MALEQNREMKVVTQQKSPPFHFQQSKWLFFKNKEKKKIHAEITLNLKLLTSEARRAAISADPLITKLSTSSHELIG